MNEKLKNEQMQILMQAILNIETEEECYAFFDDLCTVSELKSLEQRFEVARMLSGSVLTDAAIANARSLLQG